MEKIKLKPCPFCGEELNDELDLLHYGVGKWAVLAQVQGRSWKGWQMKNG